MDVSPNTRRAYAADFRSFEAWCRSRGRRALPAAPGTVLLYLLHLAEEGKRRSTLDRALSGILATHREAGHSFEIPSALAPAFADVRARTEEPVPREPVAPSALADAAARCGTDLRGLRDRALLALSAARAPRGVEWTSLDAAHVRLETGLVVVQVPETPPFTIGATDDERTCPVRALRAWIDTARITQGPIFRRITRAGTLGKRPLSPRAERGILHDRLHRKDP